MEEAEEWWEEKTIGDVAYINPENISLNYPFKEIEYLDTGSITKGVISEFQHFRLEDKPSRAQRIVRKHDVIYSLVRPIQRHYGILTGVKENTIASTGFCVIRSKGICPYFLYMQLTINGTIEMFDAIAEGSTSAYPSLKPSDISCFTFFMPPEKKLKEFSEFASKSWNKIDANARQIRILTKLRDTLLTKLMSGEVRVKIA